MGDSAIRDAVLHEPVADGSQCLVGRRELGDDFVGRPVLSEVGRFRMRTEYVSLMLICLRRISVMKTNRTLQSWWSLRGHLHIHEHLSTVVQVLLLQANANRQDSILLQSIPLHPLGSGKAMANTTLLMNNVSLRDRLSNGHSK